MIAIGSGKDIEPGAASPAKRAEPAAQQPSAVQNGRGGTTSRPAKYSRSTTWPWTRPLSRGGSLRRVACPPFGSTARALDGLVKGLGPGNGNGGFVVGSGLVQRVNTVEIDVSEAAPPGPQNNSLMWLRLRVGGIRLPGQKAPPIPGDVNQQHSKEWPILVRKRFWVSLGNVPARQRAAEGEERAESGVGLGNERL